MSMIKKCQKSFEIFTKRNLYEYKELSETEYGNLNTVTDLAHIKWKHLDNPCGASTGIFLRHNGDLVGRSMIQARNARLKGKKIDVAFVTDMLLHREYRRPISNFISLIKSIKELKQFEIIFHTSNEKTDKLYNELLHFKKPINLSGYGFPVNLRKLFEKILNLDSVFFGIIDIIYKLCVLTIYHFSKIVAGNISFKESEPDKESYEKLYENNIDPNVLTIEHDWQFIKWRYISAPLWKPVYLKILHNKVYSGHIVMRNVDINKINILTIVDYIVDKKLTKFQLFFIRVKLITLCMSKKSDAIFTLINNNCKDALRILGFPFLKIDDHYLPHKTPIFVHANNSNMEGFENDSRTKITLGDLDYF